MHVVVPFAVSSTFLPAVRLALRQDGWEEALFVQMVHDKSYFELMEQLWDRGETFAIVEHDVIPWPGLLTEMENCPEPWCTAPYYCSVGWIEDGLGCTKFSSEMTRQVTEMFEWPYPSCCKHDRHYCGLDRFIAHRMQTLGKKPHVHLPGVTNLNERWT